MKLLHQFSHITNPYSANPNDKQQSLHAPEEITSAIKPIDRELANIEVEKNEIVLKPDLSGIYKAKGKRHYQGGTPILAEPNSFVFSDYNKLALKKSDQELMEFKLGGTTKQKNTPAAVVARNVDLEHYNRVMNIIDDPKADTIAKKSSQLMLDKYQKTLGRIAYLQEERKNFKEGTPAFTEGTAPVKDQDMQNQIDEQKQYQRGGVANPYLPTAQSGKTVGQTRLDLQKYAQNQYPTVTPEQTRLDLEKYANAQSVTANSNGEIIPPQISTGIIPGDAHTRWGLHPGDKFNLFQTTNKVDVTNAADKITDLDKLATDLKYDGPKNNMAFQRWLYMDPENKKVIDKWHTTYKNGPTQGMFDGNIGIRWTNALKEIAARKPEVTTPVAPAAPITPTTAAVIDKKLQLPVDNKRYLPYNPDVKKTLPMILDETLSGLNAVNVKRYDPYLPQVKSPLIEMNYLNSQGALNSVNQSVNEAYNATRGLNPYQAQASMNEIFSKSLTNKADINFKYDQANNEIGNKQNELNQSAQRADMAANVTYGKNYYDDTVKSRSHFDNAQAVAINTDRAVRNGNQKSLDSLYNVLAQQPIAGSEAVLDRKGNQVYDANGKALMRSKPLYDVIPGTNRTYNTGVGNILNAGTSTNTINLMGEYQAAQKAFDGATDPKTKSAIKADLINLRKYIYGKKLGGVINPYN